MIIYAIFVNYHKITKSQKEYKQNKKTTQRSSKRILRNRDKYMKIKV